MNTVPAIDRAEQLARQAREAAEVRALATRPDVVALRVEGISAQVDALLWAGVGLGLLFTTVNVQRFAAGGAPAFSAVWWAAWLLDPMVSVVLLAVIRGEQVTARQQLRPAVWARVTKWTAFAATYVMNTWEAWGLHGGAPSAAGVVLHSIPPLLVLLAAEAGPELREQLARTAAAVGHSDHDAAVREPAPIREAQATEIHERRDRTAEAIQQPGVETARRRGSGHGGASPRRRMLDDYLVEARAVLASACATGDAPTVTPSWCRTVTGCSAGTSVKLAAALRATEAAAVSS
ncbi:hypothetical protein [Pseudonocardia zijingensis]|uniref:DUF2637 domain-containing protein n=1 Tax=Pseudonocardia zijingensis TaxID=153376 RepID=A0ABP3YPA8_9PSEU